MRLNEDGKQFAPWIYPFLELEKSWRFREERFDVLVEK
jgi:hypothetical protein